MHTLNLSGKSQQRLQKLLLNTLMLSATSFIKKEPIIAVALLLIIGIAAYLRLCRLSDSFHFLGDQGRDALTVSRIFTDKDIVFIGPVTSVGNMYLGPFYYYFMLPFLFLSYPSPMGPVYAVAIVNIATVALLYIWGKELVGKRAAVIAAALMAISHTVVSLSRFSWNPNIIPFFSLLLFYTCYKAWKGSPKWWIIVSIAFSVLVQLHYVTILAGVAAGVVWLIQVIQQRKDAKKIKSLLLFTLIAVAIFIASLIPLLLFDYKHNWSNASAFKSLLSSDDNFVQQTSGIQNIQKVLRETHGRSMHVFFEFTIGKNRLLNSWLVVTILAILSASYYFIWKKKAEYKGLSVLALALVIGVLGLSFYEHNVYDHYISYLFPASFLVLGYCLDRLIKIKYLGILLVVIFLVFYGQYNLTRTSFNPGGPSQTQLEKVAVSIHQRVTDGEPYSVVLLSESGDLYGMNYQYFLSTNKNKRPLSPERHHEADKLFIINEDKKSSTPEDLPIYEIVVFENKEPAEVYKLDDGMQITVLSKTKDVEK